MPSTHPRVTIEAASLPADGKLGQDRHFIGDDFVIVLDGASSPTPGDRDGGWYADVLGKDLSSRLSHGGSVDLPKALANSIADVTDRYRLRPGRSPSSTVAIARWDCQHLHGLVLGDSPIMAGTASGSVLQLRDDRLASIASEERAAYRDGLRNGHGYGDEHHSHLVCLRDAERRYRNQPEGYWIAEATPEAANHAINAIWPLADLRYILIATDGVSRGIEQYQVPASWGEAYNLMRRRGPNHLLRIIHEAENADKNGQRWPRSKRHDDKTVVAVTFATAANVQQQDP